MKLEPDALIHVLQSLSDRPRLWVGYSGGLDSHVLLHLMHRAFANHPSYQLAAIHIHHGISPQADSWVSHCETVCAALACPLTVLRVESRVQGDQSPEEAARHARFEAFKGLLGTDDALCLAHHASDQAETILWRVLRGSGPQGLGGMRALSMLGDLHCLRPLLEVSKPAFSDYARAHHLKWIEDPSNQDLRFDRNFLRHQIMPLLEKRWPQSVRSINRSGEVCGQMDDYLQRVTQQALSQLQAGATAQEGLWVSGLLALLPVERHLAIRIWLRQQGCRAPSYNHMQRIDREVLGAKAGAKPQLKIGDYVLRRVAKRLIVKFLAP